LWRLVADLVDWLTVRLDNRFLREALSRAVASVLTLIVLGLVVNQVILRGLIQVADRSAERVNATRPVGHSPPTSPLRSGGPGSPYTWESLGQDGAIFVSAGPTKARIEAVTGHVAYEPIRVFVGVSGHRTLQQDADAVVAEMDRTGAFHRSAILVMTATSTGYINESSAESLEYLLGGNTAVVSMQYSTLPSAIDLLTDRDNAPAAGRVLFGTVAARVSGMPAQHRPKLYAGGESMGSYGGNGAFSSPQDMLARVGGAVWTGTPAFTANRAALDASRNPGSPMVNPVIDNGRHIRFAGRPAQLSADKYGRPLGVWDYPRVAYLQHESDPVAWWSLDLLAGTPDWLHEARTDGPMSQMSWLPGITFWQLTADLAISNDVPGGYGHRYVARETVPAWAAVLGLDTIADRSAIIRAIADATA